MLKLDVKVNNDLIRRIEIQRTTNKEVPSGVSDDDQVNTYQWRVYRGDSTEWFAIGWIDHRYGDGAMALIGKMMDGFNGLDVANSIPEMDEAEIDPTLNPYTNGLSTTRFVTTAMVAMPEAEL